MSDVDIGVYFSETTDKAERFDMRLELIGEAGKILSNDKIDLVSVNDSPLLLRYRIVHEGIILYSADELKRSRLESKIMSLYFDEAYYLARRSRNTIERIALEGIL